MLSRPLIASFLIEPSASFWQQAARAILNSYPQELSTLRVIVPAFSHVPQLRAALSELHDRAFIPPYMNTLSGWLALQTPISDVAITPDSQRLMALYAELRQHAWLKKLFTARRNTDLLPLAQTLLTLSDELTGALLPMLQQSSESVEQRWQEALAKLTPPARKLLSDEAQLVWSIWKSQLDASDAGAARFAQMMHLAEHATEPLVWINPVVPDAMENAFLSAYAQRQSVTLILLDWRAAVIPAAYCHAWPELPDAAPLQELLQPESSIPAGQCTLLTPLIQSALTPAGLSLCAAGGLEDEAQQGAQTMVNWLQAGKSRIALIAQDRVVARRIRALLERAQILVADETGWKLSTTRAAAALAAWFDVVASRGETVALLDLLKSPFIFADLPDKSDQVMLIETTLRRANVVGGWEAASAALDEHLRELAALRQLIRQAALFSGRKILSDWIALTRAMLDALRFTPALNADAAGCQVMQLIDALEQDCAAMASPFSFAEWRAFISLQLESAPFIAASTDKRVVMLPLNGARLRSFDAVLIVGCDAANLPSQTKETLFFANAVRRELGLATRESRQHQQLRDFAEVLCANSEVVLSWQAHKNGEPNAMSTWIERLQLILERGGENRLPNHRLDLDAKTLTATMPGMAMPSASQLTPTRLSASGYNSFLACPYQFFATRMLRLSGLDDLSDMPEKRDYGGWLHQILKTYHASVLADGQQDRESLMRTISAQIFDQELAKNGAALGYYARWKKVIPAYLQWAHAREEQGWRFVIGEEWFERPLQWGEGDVLLQGRIDRVDENDSGERAVLDYKTSTQAVLKNKLKEGEDQQLPFYGLLLNMPVDSAHYVALELSKDKTGDAEAPRYIEWQQSLEKHIVGNMRAIGQDAALPSNGIESVCQYCEVRGLCRKGAW